jgi:uncharacterized protein
MAIFSAVCSLILVVYLGYQTALGRGEYRKLKQDLERGETGARARFYRRILVFECVSAALAFAALGFDPARFNPAHLGLGETPFGSWCITQWQHLDPDAMKGFLGGLIFGSAFLIVALWVRARRRAARAAATGQSSSPSRLSRILPDFGALLPTTMNERLLFALVALSAGLCEETVFRAWLLDGLHQIGLTGIALVVVASAVFGLAHFYQGVFGVVVTGLLAVVFCGLYIASGTLWLPIVVHAIIDLRACIIPSPYAESRAPVANTLGAAA